MTSKRVTPKHPAPGRHPFVPPKGVQIPGNKRQFRADTHNNKQVTILRELPEAGEERIMNIHRRNELLRSNALYNARLERQRANSCDYPMQD